MNAAQLRDSFLIDELVVPGETRLVYTFLDRMIVGSVVPTVDRLELTGNKELASEYFAERRVLGQGLLTTGMTENKIPHIGGRNQY